MQNRRTGFHLLIVCAAVELLLFVWLCSLGNAAFREFVWSPDTYEYNHVALQLAEKATLIPGRRTLGYPLFLSLAYFVGGRTYGIYLVIVTQLVLNLVFTWICWRLLQQTAPSTGVRLRSGLTLLFFCAGVGMALYVLSDFLAAFLFGVFLYGMLFWRNRSSVLVSGPSLVFATLTRPTFTFIPLLLPMAAYLVGRFSSKVPRYHLVMFTVLSIAATSISVTYQYTADGYLGPSPILVQAVQDSIYVALMEDQVTRNEYMTEFEAEVGRQAGRPFVTLSRGEQEKYSRQIFLAALISHPRQIILSLVKNLVKYIFVPVESVVQRLTARFLSEQTYMTYGRPILALLWLPMWLLSLIPPIGSPKRYRMYYLLVMMFLFYVLSVNIMAPRAGERYRFPVLAFMLPLVVLNVQDLRGYLRRGLKPFGD